MDILTINQGVRYRLEANDAALVFQHDAIYFLNSTAAFILQACEVPQSINSIVARLRQSFENTEELDLNKEVRECLGRLIGHRILKKEKISQQEFEILQLNNLLRLSLPEAGSV